MTLNDLLPLIQSEMDFAHKKYGNYHSAHEQYAVLQEEVEEWWNEVKNNFHLSARAHYELIQIAAIALRWVIENGAINAIKWTQEERHEKEECN